MAVQSQPKLTTWWRSATDEVDMELDHAYLWRHVIASIPEQNLSEACVMDYGCSRGGFLQTLYHNRPFRRGIGVDIAETSLAAARQRHIGTPMVFITPDQMPAYAGEVDIAFSHEVIYLLPDLAAHAAGVAETLRDSGVYYATIGCHTANPLWSKWRDLIAATSHLPVYDYSLDDYAKSFWQAGLQVSMKSFAYDDFVLMKPENSYFPSVADSLEYHTAVKTIIRARKRS